MTAIVTEQMLAAARKRRQAGESLKVIAADSGVSWQKLDKALRHGLRQHHPEGLLVEKYRPRRLAEIVGQEAAVATLRKLAARPYPCVLLLAGETGTGKTSAALALAGELGCSLEHREMGGVFSVASGEQTAENVCEAFERLWLRPFYGSGWKVLIVNEADRMSPKAETIWLDRLENLPQRAMVIFTTNHPQSLSQRLRDRCMTLPFASDAQGLGPAATKLLERVWKTETGRRADAALVQEIIRAAAVEGQLSFRRVLQAMQACL